MTTVKRFLSSPSGRVVGLAVALVLLVQAIAVVLRAGGEQEQAAAGGILPVETKSAAPVAAASPSAQETPFRAPSAKRAKDRAAVFRGFGAWVDGYDYPDVDLRAAVATMKRHGVRTVYLQTGRYSSKADVDPNVGPWLAAVKEAGMDAVGWYLPAYDDMARELRRVVAIAEYRYAGHRFDGLGIDIEYRDAVPNPLTWSRRVAQNAERARRVLGASYPISAIVPPPLQMDIAPLRWAGFPWERLGEVSDAFVLMAYWSFRKDCPAVRNHCPYGYTRYSTERTRELSGKRDIVVHVAGGEAEFMSRKDTRDFLRGVRHGRADGYSIYDYRTTAAHIWPILADAA